MATRLNGSGNGSGIILIKKKQRQQQHKKKRTMKGWLRRGVRRTLRRPTTVLLSLLVVACLVCLTRLILYDNGANGAYSLTSIVREPPLLAPPRRSSLKQQQQDARASQMLTPRSSLALPHQQQGIRVERAEPEPHHQQQQHSQGIRIERAAAEPQPQQSQGIRIERAIERAAPAPVPVPAPAAQGTGMSMSDKEIMDILLNEEKDVTKDSFSACLLIMDDNHYLVEWLAYHYYALPLRYLVVAVDPRSQTSPSHILKRYKDYNLTVVEWQDHDYMNTTTLHEAESFLVYQYGNHPLKPKVLRHRARQRLFYYECMKHLQKQGRSWTILSDTDEFVHLNYSRDRRRRRQALNNNSNRTKYPLPSLERPASIWKYLKLFQRIDDTNITHPTLCVQMPRIRYGSIESTEQLQNQMLPQGFNASTFQTFRWRNHARIRDFTINKISKSLVDLSRIQSQDLKPVSSIHRPIKAHCTQRGLHIQKPDSDLIMNHYLGTYDQYAYRDDARPDLRNADWFRKYSNIQGGRDDEIRPWLAGFVNSVGLKAAQQLLQGVGILESKNSSLAYSTLEPFAPDPDYDDIDLVLSTTTSTASCALLFFGLPRAYKSLVLPSIKQNLLYANPSCDVFVHYYNRTTEPPGRRNKGGTIDPNEITLLADYIREKQPHRVVAMTYDTEQDFWDKRGSLVEKYRETRGPDGMKLYYPWNARTYHYPTSLDNIVKQWHSINAAWTLMEETTSNKRYETVGMFRNDVFFASPIYMNYRDNVQKTPLEPNEAIMPPFALMPANDRMIYGPYDAIKIWATKRFELVEDHVHNYEPGYGMHSERFLNASVFTAMKKQAHVDIHVNPDICFFRTRADDVAMVSDCQSGGVTRGYERLNKRGLIQEIIGRECVKYPMEGRFRAVQCSMNNGPVGTATAAKV